jgi:hypothetical protein
MRHKPLCIPLSALMLAMLAMLETACVAPAMEPNEQRLIVFPSTSRQEREPRLIRADELRSTDAGSLREAIEKTRPDFLRATPAVFPSTEPLFPLIFVDGTYIGGSDILQLIPVAETKEVRYLRPTAARLAFGAFCRCDGGVVAVTTWAAR